MVGKIYFVYIYFIKRSSQGRNKKINENLIFRKIFGAEVRN